MEAVFKLGLDWLDFVLERVVGSAGQVLNRNHLSRQLHLDTLATTTHLVLIVLNERRFHHVNTVLSLNLLAVVQQELLISAQLLLDGLHRYLIDCVADLE